MLPSNRDPLTEEQKAQIAANRAKAIERAKLQAAQKQAAASGGAAAAAPAASSNPAPAAVAPPHRPQPPIVQQQAAATVTAARPMQQQQHQPQLISEAAAAATRPLPPEEQKALIAANREAAIARAAAVAAARSMPPVLQPQPARAASLNDAPTPPQQQQQPAPTRTNSGPLTEEQKAQIAVNREAAIAKRAATLAAEAAAAAAPPTTTSHSSFGSWAGPSTAAAPVRQASAAAAPAPPVISPPAPIFRRIRNVEATIAIFSPARFKVVLRPYLSDVTDALRSCPSRSWDNEQKVNTFLFSDMNAVLKALSECKEAEIRVVRLPENVVRILTKKDSGGREKTALNPTGDLTSGVDPGLLQRLFPYQRKGVEFGITKGGRVLIADEMGLGKSIQALAIARYYRHDFPLAIVCPASVKSAWKQQIELFCPAISVNLYMMQKEKEPLPAAHTSNTVVIMSYDYLMRKEKDLVNAKYNVWIFDESHYVKDMKSKRTRAAIAVARTANRVILLSGTPALSRPAELFSQIKIIDPSLFSGQKEFLLRYCDGQDTPYGFQAKGATNSEELSAILQKRIMIRRLKAEVLNDLPPKIREVINITSDEITSRIDKSRLTSSRAFDQGTWNASDESLLEYYTHTGTAKARPVCDHIIDNYFYEGSDDTRKILVFGHHQIVLDTIEHNLANHKINCIRIDGRTPSANRGELCRQFQEDPNIRVAVLSITAAGQGITLTAASVVIFAEIYWIPGNMQQAEDRAHRVGQKDCVQVKYMLAQNTADDLIWPLIKSKTEILAQVNLNAERFIDAKKTEIDTDNVVWDIDDNDEDVAPSTNKRRRL